jgi:hypothetical protein
MSDTKFGVSGVGSIKKDQFNTNERKINLEITQEYWSKTAVNTKPGSCIVSKVTVKNTGDIVLKDVTVQVDIDDESVLFDAVLCNSNGQIENNQRVSLNFGDLSVGVSSSKLQYWWSVRAAFDEVDDVGTKKTKVSLRLYPQFTADFKQSGQAFTSQSELEKS